VCLCEGGGRNINNQTLWCSAAVYIDVIISTINSNPIN